MNKHALVYIVRREVPSNSIWCDLEVPVLQCIATVRAHNPDIAIYVLNLNEQKQHWGDACEFLNFKVIDGFEPYFERLGLKRKCFYGNLHQDVSRVADLKLLSEQIPEDVIIYSDTDVYWLKDPILMEDKGLFVGTGNLGVFYFNKTSSKVQSFLTMFVNEMTKAMVSTGYREKLMKYSPGLLMSESLLRILNRDHESQFDFIKPMRECYEVTPITYNFMPCFWFWHPHLIKDAFNFHFCGTNGYNTKTRFMPLMMEVKEITEPLRKVFGEDHLKHIFDGYYKEAPSVSVATDEFKNFIHDYVVKVANYNNDITELVKAYMRQK